MATVGAVAFAASASHVLALGHHHQVTGWHSWSVAGTVEILAAYAVLEYRRRAGLARVLPALVFIISAGFLILANLASEPRSWAADLLPWGQIYAAVPPVSFLAVALIVETKGWHRPTIKVKKPPKAKPQVNTQVTGSKTKAMRTRFKLRSVGPNLPTVKAGEDRDHAVERWVREGCGYNLMIRAGKTHWDLSATTMKRVIGAARTRVAS